MVALAGKNITVWASPDGTTFHQVLDLKQANMQDKATAIDVSEFGDTWMERILGLKDVQLQLQGFFNPADTTGQVEIFNNWLADSLVYVGVLWDNTTGTKAQYIVTQWQVSGQVNGAVDLSTTLDSSGPQTAFTHP